MILQPSKIEHLSYAVRITIDGLFNTKSNAPPLNLKLIKILFVYFVLLDEIKICNHCNPLKMLRKNRKVFFNDIRDFSLI